MADTKISALTALTAKTLATDDKFAIDDVSAAASRSTVGSDIQFLVEQGLGIYNVKNYGALGDNSTDDRAAIQSAIDAIATNGSGVIYFPVGTYIIGGAGLTTSSVTKYIIWRGAGNHASVLKTAASTQTGTTFINIAWNSHQVFEDLGFQSVQTTHTVAISDAANDTYEHDLNVNRCWFSGWRDATPALGGTGKGAIYSWRTNGLRVTNCEIEDCEYGVYADESIGPVLIEGNRVVNTATTRMVVGLFASSSVTVSGGVRIANNWVEGANCDPAANGSAAFGILVYQTPGAVITGNHTKGNGVYATVNGNLVGRGGGILMSGSAWGAVISNNSLINEINALYIEGDGSNIGIGTAGSRRGASCIGNTIFGGQSAGIDCSYSAGAQIIGNTIAEQGGPGIVVDSDYVTVEANMLLNNNRIDHRPPQLERAQMRIYAGTGDHITNNTIIDNRGTLPAQVTGQSRAAGAAPGPTGTFFYKIVALNYWGEGPASAETTSLAVTNQRVTLSWSTVTGATGYRIYRGTTTGQETFLVDVGVVLTYDDTGAITPDANVYTGNYYGLAFDATLAHVINGNTVKNVIVLPATQSEYYVSGTSTSSIRGDNSPSWVNDDRYVSLTANATANSTTTAAKITGLDLNLLPGNWYFKYAIRYQSSITTTGVKFSVNHTGTVTSFVANMTYVDAAATASTGAPSQAANASTAQVVGGYSIRAKSTAAGIGPTLSVDTQNADMLMLIEGMAVVTVLGNLELYHASETAASTQVMAGSSLQIQRVG